MEVVLILGDVYLLNIVFVSVVLHVEDFDWDVPPA
jgi:hypothetical protein